MIADDDPAWPGMAEAATAELLAAVPAMVEIERIGSALTAGSPADRRPPRCHQPMR
ncbi:hypothetical protein [Allorhizocola rhizosphaerae]|uniref:hypothetical protein n=1 Tax=Allorhizocola rhizosphaerae TaxID=1872709 RepID=UPI0013C31144|nr:hypothetical protein [Allorhizocola rhizosphaerae]